MPLIAVEKQMVEFALVFVLQMLSGNQIVERLNK